MIVSKQLNSKKRARTCTHTHQAVCVSENGVLVALTFIRVSLGYMECKRIYEGKCLTKNQKSPSYLYAMLDWLGARIIATILFPIHMLAKKLVYSKIHSAIGFSKAGISGGGSLPSHVDRFFEAIGVTLQNGYGLTETSPVIAARRLSCNVSHIL